MKTNTLHSRQAIILCGFLLGFFGVSWGQQQNVFSRSDAGTGFWWHSNNPWYYATWNNNQDRPDNNSNTRNYVKIGHNNNTSMTTNGAFFTLASLDFESGASAPRTIAADVSSSGLSFTIGIFNASTGTHSFSTNIGVDAATVSFQNNNIGGMVFSGNFYLNSNTADFGGSGTGNFDVSAILSGTNGKIVKNGTNSLVLSGANTYTGITTINAGTLQLNKAGGATLPSGNSITVNNGGTLRISSNQTLADLTINSGGTVLVDANVQLTIDGALINNGTFTLESGATFKQGSSISGNGIFNVKQTITGANNGTAPNGRFWYMGVPMSGLTKETAFGNTTGSTETKVWSFNETVANGWGSPLSTSTALEVSKGYAVRTGESNPTITFTGNNLFSSDPTIPLTYTNGYGNGYHLLSNSYMVPISWEAIYAASNNIDATYWVRSYNGSSLTLDFDTYNAASNQSVNPSTLLTNEYIAPLQSFWVRALPNTSNQSITMAKTMTSHQSGNTLKSSIDFPVFARVNLIDDNKFDQTLIYMDQSMSSNFDAYDSEKMFVSGKVQLYTKVGAKKLVMNGLKNNKKKISAPLYLELPTSKVYQLQLAEFNMEEGLILLEDKQEGVIQDFTINDTYTFFADAGNLQNRFVLHFTMPQAGPTAQGPSNNWVNEQSTFGEVGNIEINSDGNGKVEIILESLNESKVSGNLSVTDVNGKIIYNSTIQESKTVFNLETATGIYYLSVQSGDLIQKKKIFIQK